MKAFNNTMAAIPEGRLRLLSACILAPVVLAVTYLGGPAYAGLIALIVATGLYEWLRLVDAEAPMPDRCGLYAALVLALVLAAVGLPIFSLIALAMAGAAFYAHRSNVDPSHAFWFALGLPYMACSGVALIYLRATPAIGLSLALYLLAVVWGMDIGAYFVGRTVGGPKLAPAISPNKTWSGFIGGTALAAMLAAIVLLTTGARSFAAGLIVAVLLAMVAQAGDLFKSLFKRRAGVKDCGTLIPGHGGVLDRVDGLVFAAMALALLQALFGSGMIW